VAHNALEIGPAGETPRVVHPYFVQRIPADVLSKARGMKLVVPLGDGKVPLAISPKP
jgi:hypothetical protein